MVCGCTWCLSHFLLLPQVGAAQQPQARAITRFLVLASTFPQAPPKVGTSVNGVIPGGEPKTHPKVLKVH